MKQRMSDKEFLSQFGELYAIKPSKKHSPYTRLLFEAKRAREAEKYWEELAIKLNKAIASKADEWDEMEARNSFLRDGVRKLEEANFNFSDDVIALKSENAELKAEIKKFIYNEMGEKQ
jgi:hypothetical protein